MQGIDAYAGGGLLPALVNGGVEHQPGVGGDHQPGAIHQLLLELPCAPAGIAQRHQPVVRGLVRAQGLEDVLGGGDHHLVAHLQGGVEAGPEAVQHEAAISMDRAALQHRLFHLGGGGWAQLELGQHGVQGHVHRDVDHQSHGSLAAVLAQIDQGAFEVGVREARHGEQKMVLQCLHRYQRVQRYLG